jgi:hypothetical protein
MNAASRYWNLIRIDAQEGCKREEIPEAKAFFLDKFPEFAAGQNVSELLIQRQLCHWVRGEELNGDSSKQTLAELCLRCFISKQIEHACIHLEAKFGIYHGFTRYDLFPFLLTDVALGVSRRRRAGEGFGEGSEPALNSFTPSSSVRSTYSSLATEILQTFNPERGNLATWTIRLVKHHRELKAFLLEYGVYLVSDWAILNDTSPEQLSRIFSEFHQFTAWEIQHASILLESYHTVYRRARLASPRTGIQGQCQLPTTEQLEKIAQRFHSHTNLMLPAQEVMQRLQELAELLRQYRLCVRRGLLPTESLDDPNLSREAHFQLSNNWLETDDSEKLQAEFLAFYRQRFINCLDQALKQVIGDRITYLQRKKSPKSQHFLTALHLFHCRGTSMGEIAPRVGLQAQYQVSRLLKLKELRADVRQKMLKALLDCILEQAKSLADPEHLPCLDQKQVEAALDEEIAKIMQEAEVEAEVNSNRNNPLKSLFSRRLCRSLSTES